MDLRGRVPAVEADVDDAAGDANMPARARSEAVWGATTKHAESCRWVGRTPRQLLAAVGVSPAFFLAEDWPCGRVRASPSPESEPVLQIVSACFSASERRPCRVVGRSRRGRLPLVLVKRWDEEG